MTQVFLTTTGAGQQWAVPSDFSSTNTIDTIGAGGSGGACSSVSPRASGGGAGGFSRTTNLSLSLGALIDYRVGSGGAAVNTGSVTGAYQGINGGDSWFNSTTLAGSSVGAEGGKAGAASTSASVNGGLGGAIANGIGSTKTAGGRGGNCTNTATTTGGGGAGGPSGGGNAGVNNATAQTGTNGGSGDAGSGGAAGVGAGAVNGNGGAGGNGTEYDASHGSGGGGGGSRGASNFSGGTGGLYGGGGGGAYAASNALGTSGAGRQGLVRIDYVPVTTTDWDGSADLVPTSSLSTDARVYKNAFSQLDASSSLAATAIQIWNTNTAFLVSDLGFVSDTDIISTNNPVKLSATSSFFTNAKIYTLITTSLPCSSVLSVDASVTRRASATLPCSSDLSLIVSAAIASSVLSLSSSLASATLWYPAALANLAADSAFRANVTKQFFAAEAAITPDSSLLLNTIQYFKGLATLSASSDLSVVASKRIDTFPKWPISSSLSVKTIQKFAGIATLPLSGLFSISFGVRIPATTVLPASASVIANARVYKLITSALAPSSALAVDAKRYIPAKPSSWAASSALLANALRYSPTTALWAGASTLSSVAKVKYASSAVLAASGDWLLNALRFTPVRSDWSFSINFFANTTYRAGPRASLPVSSTITADIFLLQNKIKATLPGTLAILVDTKYYLNARSSIKPTSALSSSASIALKGLANLGPTATFQAFPIQKMFETSNWFLTSKINFKIDIYKLITFDDFNIVSHLRADTVIDRLDHPAEGHYALHGNIKKKTKSSSFVTAKRLRGGNKVKHPYHPKPG